MASEGDNVINDMYNVTGVSTDQLRDQALLEKAHKGSKMIWVTFRKEGLHKYPAALDDPKLATGEWDDVSFLGYVHRHIFHFKVWIEVFHDDRDIEFIQFKRWLQRLYNNDSVLELNNKSCEMIADELYEVINDKYPNRFVRISVAEDNENGCEMDYPVHSRPLSEEYENVDSGC